MDPTGPVSTMSTITGAVTSAASAFSGMVADWIGVITDTGNELLLFFIVGVPMVGIGIGLLKRLINVN